MHTRVHYKCALHAQINANTPMNIKRAIRKLKRDRKRFSIFRITIGVINVLLYGVFRPKYGNIVTTQDGLIIRFEYPSQFVPTLVCFKELAEPEYTFVREFLDAESIFFDVGSGIGGYSLLAAKQRSREIHSFEPVEENYRTMQMNMEANGFRNYVRLNKMAVSDESGHGLMKATDNLLGSVLDLTRESHPSNTVEVTTIDTYCQANNIGRIDVLKIDTEGNELRVIRGAKNLLHRQSICVIICEIEKDLHEVHQIIHEIGFEIYLFDCINKTLKLIDPLNENSINHLKNTAFSNLLLIHNNTIERVKRTFPIIGSRDNTKA